MKSQTTLFLAAITIDPALNVRAGLDEATVARYRLIFDRLPAPVVFRLPDGTYLLAAGFHRLEAARQLGLEAVSVELREGDRIAAREFALRDNLAHGKSLSRAEWRKAIAEFLKLYPARSDAWIAADLGVDGHTVRSVREELERTSEIPRLDRLIGADGKDRPRALRPADPIGADERVANRTGGEPAAAIPADFEDSPAEIRSSPPEGGAASPPARPGHSDEVASPEPPAGITWTVIQAEFLAWASHYEGERFHTVLADTPYSIAFLNMAWDAPAPREGLSYQAPTFGDGSFKELRLPSFNRVANVRCRTCNRWQVDHPGRACDCAEPDFPDANQVQMAEYQQWVAEWAAALAKNVLYPGAVCAFFGGTRTFHRLAAGLEDAGFEIFDCLMWLYGQGMTKGLNMGKAFDADAFDTWLSSVDHGLSPAEVRLARSTAVQGGVPALERHRRSLNGSTGGLLHHFGPETTAQGEAVLADLIETHWAGPAGTLPPGVRLKVGERTETSGWKSINAANAQIGYRPRDYYADKGNTLPITVPATEAAIAWQGFNTTLKPAWEPIILCRAPRRGLSFVELARRYGTGALNIEAARIALPGGQAKPGGSPADTQADDQPGGRWPANLLLAHLPGCECLGLGSVPGRRADLPKTAGRQDTSQWRFAPTAATARGYASENGQEAAEVWACVCGCANCGSEWVAATLEACPACGGLKVAWLCPVRALDEQAGERAGGQRKLEDGRWRMEDGSNSALSSILHSPASSAPLASRFFYVAKVAPWEAHAGVTELYWRKDEESPTGYCPLDRGQWEKLPEADRAQGNIHPTRKPARLTDYLFRLICPPANLRPRLLVPFCGSGGEAIGASLAAKALGVNVEIVGVEQDPHYCHLARQRLDWWARVDSYEAARRAAKRKAEPSAEGRRGVRNDE